MRTTEQCFHLFEDKQAKFGEDKILKSISKRRPNGTSQNLIVLIDFINEIAKLNCTGQLSEQ